MINTDEENYNRMNTEFDKSIFFINASLIFMLIDMVVHIQYLVHPVWSITSALIIIFFTIKAYRHRKRANDIIVAFGNRYNVNIQRPYLFPFIMILSLMVGKVLGSIIDLFSK